MAAIFGHGTEFGRPMGPRLSAAPKFGNVPTSLGRSIGSGFGTTLKAALPPKPPKASPTQGAAGGTVAGGGAPAGAPPAGGPGTDYDSQYQIDLANATKIANDKIAGYVQSEGDLGTNLQTNQQTLARNLALQTTGAQNAENARGGFGLGALGQRIGNLGLANQAQATGLTAKYGHDMEGLTNAITAAQDGLSTETIALQLASRARQAKLVADSGGTLGTGGGGSGGGGGGGAGGAGRPSAPAQPPGASLTGLHAAGAPAGASLTGLRAATPPPRFGAPKVGRGKVGYHGGF